MTEFLNQTDFANHIGKTKGYITQLKQAGRLVMSADGLRVDVQASIARIAETADHNRDDVVQRHAVARGDLDSDSFDDDQIDQQSYSIDSEMDVTKVTFAEARARGEHYKALRAKLDYEKEIGEVVLVADMRHAVTDMITALRQSLENLPHRLAPVLVGKDLDFIRSEIRREVADSLKNLQSDFEARLKDAN